MKILCVSGFCPGVDKDPEGYVRSIGIEYIQYLGYHSMIEQHEFLVDEFPAELPKYFSKSYRRNEK